MNVEKITRTAYAVASTIQDIDWDADSPGVYILTNSTEALWVYDLDVDGYLIEHFVATDHPDGPSPVSEHRTDDLEDVAHLVASFVNFSGSQIMAEAAR